nr:HD1-like protein without homeodomain [Mycoleptodonoides aitchisonii]
MDAIMASLQERLSHVEDDLFVALQGGRDALDAFDVKWTNLLHDISQESCLDDETGALAYATASRVAVLAELFADLADDYEELTADITGDLESILSRMTLADIEPVHSPQTPAAGLINKYPLPKHARVSPTPSLSSSILSTDSEDDDLPPPIAGRKRSASAMSDSSFDNQARSDRPRKALKRVHDTLSSERGDTCRIQIEGNPTYDRYPRDPTIKSPLPGSQDLLNIKQEATFSPSPHICLSVPAVSSRGLSRKRRLSQSDVRSRPQNGSLTSRPYAVSDPLPQHVLEDEDWLSTFDDYSKWEFDLSHPYLDNTSALDDMGPLEVVTYPPFYDVRNVAVEASDNVDLFEHIKPKPTFSPPQIDTTASTSPISLSVPNVDVDNEESNFMSFSSGCGVSLLASEHPSVLEFALPRPVRDLSLHARASESPSAWEALEEPSPADLSPALYTNPGDLPSRNSGLSDSQAPGDGDIWALYTNLAGDPFASDATGIIQPQKQSLPLPPPLSMEESWNTPPSVDWESLPDPLRDSLEVISSPPPYDWCGQIGRLFSDMLPPVGVDMSSLLHTDNTTQSFHSSELDASDDLNQTYIPTTHAFDNRLPHFGKKSSCLSSWMESLLTPVL